MMRLVYGVLALSCLVCGPGSVGLWMTAVLVSGLGAGALGLYED